MQQLCCLRDAVYTLVGMQYLLLFTFTHLTHPTAFTYSLTCRIFGEYKHLLTDTRRHCAILNPELLPFGLAEGQAGRRLHSRLWDARKLAKRLVPKLGLPLAALACVTGAAPLSLGGKILLMGGNCAVSLFAWQTPYS